MSEVLYYTGDSIYTAACIAQDNGFTIYRSGDEVPGLDPVFDVAPSMQGNLSSACQAAEALRLDLPSQTGAPRNSRGGIPPDADCNTTDLFEFEDKLKAYLSTQQGSDLKVTCTIAPA